MNPNIKDAILAAFVADALSLGVHWVYNTSEIDAKYGRLENMVKPELAPYHTSKDKGEFTHYGDQMMVLLESLVHGSGFDFDLNRFSQAWRNLFSAYDGYMDQASKETLANFKAGSQPETSGAISMDLGGAARIVPLILCYGDDIDAFVKAARAQTAMTHNSAQAIECAELFARVSAMVLNGAKPIKAFERALEKMPEAQKIQALVQTGLESRSQDTRKAIARMGQMCAIEGALPATIHLIAKYENNLKEALIENIMAGGDSSARGILTGFVLGCYKGIDTLPKQWLADMTAHEKILGLIH
ncbi:DraG2 [Desulforapulum autotrophicum HRM2]|uniref:DraG2 n=1 Tax=Desulforapulum autotrophicum (strain ATCC 43914 / DSM 3382 / VKM B-1955 / HRM2) TaxID=177437 RepID=C0QAR1_DESAH|nr:ADP-ribosylglycohydrolase family protein [Desulforapulum autotrophicum]ACN16844.1 DraG2 [Desulforapulum autotrophicum HRM2]